MNGVNLNSMLAINDGTFLFCGVAPHAAMVPERGRTTDGTAQSKAVQTLDVHGNLTQAQVFDYGNLNTPARTYNNTYLTDTNYTSQYIYNRLLLSSVTVGSATTPFVSNLYDSGATCSGIQALSQSSATTSHDDAHYGISVIYRGNVSPTTGVQRRRYYLLRLRHYRDRGANDRADGHCRGGDDQLPEQLFPAGHDHAKRQRQHANQRGTSTAFRWASQTPSAK
jgi:hypothetical protein